MSYDSTFEHFLLWGAPERMWCVPLMAILIVAVWVWCVQYRSRVKYLVHSAHSSLVLPGFAPWRLIARAVLLTIALAAMAIAFMQPQWGRKEIAVMQEGRDVLIALDISGSMQAQDVKPSRLAFVKLKVRKLLERLSFERVGLILFSGTAFVQCPLTADYQTFLLFLEQVTTESISSGTTAIGTAVTKAAEIFNRSENRKNKLLLLITDGEDFASNKKQLADLVAKEKITVFSWGVGTTQGAPVPLYDARGTMVGYAKNKDGSVATSALNETLLQELSASVGGRYERVSQDDGDIVRIVDVLAAYEREQLEERHISHYHDRYPLFLAVTWGCLLLEWLL
ncbi:MAG: Ca-activated chloride channel [Candidatus Dependentiae bacterium]|nr:Ca-activated chloride channel [Candidatus Dependentiae bacterium]